MSFGVNKGKDFIYVIPVLVIIGIIYLMLYRQGDLDEKLPEKLKSDKANKVLEVAPQPVDNTKENKQVNLKKEDNMENNLEVGKTYTTDSGLKYEVLKLGTGPKPGPTDVVEVHYHGTLEDGTVFDSSVDRGEKISFGLDQVIVGWTEGLQLMPVGSKFKFTIPAELAYGPAGSGHPLSGKTLIFEVELFEIK